VKKLVFTLCFIVAVGAMAGCASSRAAGNGDRGASGSSGVTVFGTIDAGVSGTRNRSSRD
jgi:hypothetical protein